MLLSKAHEESRTRTSRTSPLTLYSSIRNRIFTQQQEFVSSLRTLASPSATTLDHGLAQRLRTSSSSSHDGREDAAGASSEHGKRVFTIGYHKCSAVKPALIRVVQ